MITKMKNKSPVLVMLLFIMLGLIVGGTVYAMDSTRAVATPSAGQELPVVGSYENLQSLLEKYGQNNSQRYYGQMAIDDGSAVNMKSAESLPTAAGSEAADYSSTNVQVQGVDEGDLVKTDGQYIYQINKNHIQIIKAIPADKMQVVNTIKFNDKNFTPIDLYLDGDYLIVVGNTYINQPAYEGAQSQLKMMPSYAYQNSSLCRAIVYNIKDKQNITQIRRLVLEGSYLSSRMVGSNFYLLSNRSIDYYSIQNGTDLTPICKDTIKVDQYISEDIKTIRYFPGCISPNYLIVGSIDLQQMQQPADINTYLGSGENIYASTQNLYVAISQYNDKVIQPMPVETERVAPSSSSNDTIIYKFEMQGAKLQYAGKGQVPGTILNQFSMDEYGENFRIATTTGESWRSDEYTSQNNVYILDQDLQLKGKIENIAPGERIYSTRFMGNRAYMVTFKQVDPFFVLDLTDPVQPKILGKLKIPGYSDYLQPYDENHIIGFGKETIETSSINGQSTAFYQGIKIAIFDVTNVSQPVEMSKVVIGDRGTDSELLRNHKALLFSREKNLLALPVTIMTVDQQNAKAGSIPDYGSFSFQGAYVYNIDLQQGLQLKGKITHLDSEDYLKSGSYWDNTDKSIARILYIGDTLYTLSPHMIKSNQLENLQETQALSLD